MKLTLGNDTNKLVENEKAIDPVKAVKNSLEPVKFKSDEEKRAFEKKLDDKIEGGEKLSQSEIAYLSRNDPNKFMQVKRIESQCTLVKSNFKRSSSKLEVLSSYYNAVSAVKTDDPYKKAIINSYTREFAEYKKTRKYNSLKEYNPNKKSSPFDMLNKIFDFRA